MGWFVMEEWQKAMVETAVHTKDMKESLGNVATKDDLDSQTKEICAEIKASTPKNGLKDKLLWIAFLVICSIAGGTSVVALAVKFANGGG
jgi:hypothetical protein